MNAMRRIGWALTLALGLTFLATCQNVERHESIDRQRLDYARRAVARAADNAQPLRIQSRPSVNPPLKIKTLWTQQTALLSALGRKPETIAKRRADFDSKVALDLDEFLLIAWEKHADLAAARENLEATYARYQQMDWLGDLVRSVDATRRLGRSFGGPPLAGVRADRALSPWPSIESIRGQIVDQDLRLAHEGLRAALITKRAEIIRRGSDLREMSNLVTLAARHSKLIQNVAEILRARLSSGSSLQAEILATEARHEDLLRLHAERLAKSRDAIRAFCEAVGQEAPTGYTEIPADLTPKQILETDVNSKSDPKTEMAAARRDRIAAGLRLAETVTRVRADAGTARFERRHSAEGGTARNGILTDPLPKPKARALALGPAFALIEEARRRLVAANSTLKSVQSETQREREAAGVAITIKRAELATLEKEILPRIRAAYDSQLESLGRDKAGYLDVIRAAQQLIDTEERQSRVRRALAYACARALVATGRPLKK